MKIHKNFGVAGRARWRAMNPDRSAATEWSNWTQNLVMNNGFTGYWQRLTRGCAVGTGTNPNKFPLEGTFSQSGTTVTRSTGNGEFAAGNVGDFVKFGSGEIAAIVSFTNVTTVEVDRSQTVAETSLTRYYTSRNELDAWAKGTSTKDRSYDSEDYNTGIATIGGVYDFELESSAATYTEIALANNPGDGGKITTRLVFDSPVNVDAGQFLQIEYVLLVDASEFASPKPFTAAITGWPYPYGIQSITSDGTYWTVEVDPAYGNHLVAGRDITIDGATPPPTSINSISSTASDFTVSATGHGLSSGDSIEIEGATPIDYNGSWTIDTVPDANTLTVSSSVNPGAGSGGTVRLSTPATWFDGTHTIHDLPTDTTFRIANTDTPPDAGINGTVYNNLNGKVIFSGWPVDDKTWLPCQPVSNSNAATPYAFREPRVNLGRAKLGTFTNFLDDDDGDLLNPTVSSKNYDAGTRKITYSQGASQESAINWDDFKGFALSFSRTTFSRHTMFFAFDELQRKDEGYLLTWVPNLEITWDPALD